MLAPHPASFITVILLVTAGMLPWQAGDPTARRVSDTAERAEELFQEALMLSVTKDRELARSRALEAIRLWKQDRQPEKAARAAVQIGDSCLRVRRFQDSLFYYKQALEIARAPASVRAIGLCSLADVYARLYLRQLATHYYAKAVTVAEGAKDVMTQAKALTGLATVAYESGQMDQAITHITDACQLTGEQNGNDAAALLHLRGQIHQEEGMLSEAREAFNESLGIYRATGNETGFITVLSSISALDLLSGQNRAARQIAEEAVEKAEEQGRRALTTTDKLNAMELRWRASLSLARAQRALGQLDEAKDSYFRATSHLTAIWWSSHIFSDNVAVAFREETQTPYRELVDLLVEQGHFEEAFEQSENSRSRALLGLIEARRVSELPRNVKEDGAVRKLFRSLTLLRTKWLSSGVAATDRAKLQADISAVELAIEEAHSRSEMKRARERLVWFRPAGVKQLQDSMIRQNEVILSFLLGAKRSLVWLVTPNSVSCEFLPPRREIEEAVTRYLTLAENPSNLHIERDLSKLNEIAANLFSATLSRLYNRIPPESSLIIVPDGILHYLPFEALRRDGRYVIQDHDVSYLSSASLLRLLRMPRTRTELRDRLELLAVGDPIFEPVQKRSLRKTTKNMDDAIARDMRAGSGFSLGPLPRTRDEVQYVGGLFPAERQRVYLGKESTEDAVKREVLRRYRRLHFATHSLVDERSPSRSAVVLTLDDDPKEDGFLEVNEISELDLDCDLVVLSACQTGRGKLSSGEGIIGLSRAFLHAGARSVVVSLWRVTDISTAELMKSFYQYLTGGLDSAAALRQAKLQMLRSKGEMRHPYYWAPFVVVGNP